MRYQKIASQFYNNKDNSYILKKLVVELKKLMNENDCEKYHKLLAEIYIELKEYELARSEYGYLRYLNKENPSVYYSLFKINLLLNDDKYLLSDLKKYEENTTDNADISVIYGLLNIYLFKKNKLEFKFTFTNSGYILTNKIIDNDFNSFYNKFIDELNNKDYKNALKFLNKCLRINEERNLSLSLFPLENLLNKIINLNDDINYKDIKEEYLINNDYENFIKICKIQEKYDKYPIDETYVDTDILIDLGEYELVNSNLYRIKTGYLTNDDKLYYKYLSSKYEEIKNMTYEVKEDIEYIKFYLNKKQFLNALFYAENGLKKHNLNIYKYYLGKIYYRMNNYKKAIYYFKEYLNFGGAKMDTAYFYLSFIFLKFKDYNRAYTNFEKSKKIKNKFNKKIDKDFNFYTNLIYNLNDDDGRKEYNLSKKFKMTIDDFSINP